MKKILITTLSVMAFNAVAEGSGDAVVFEEPNMKEHWSGLPIWGAKAKELGYNLPIPIGISLFANTQEVNYISENDFILTAHGGMLGGLKGQKGYIVPKDDVSITGNDQSIQLRADAWIFPFLNVYGLAGYTEGNKDITVTLQNAKNENRKPLPFLNKIKQPITIGLDYNAYNLGIGVVAATQVRVHRKINPIIITVAGTATNAWTNMTDSTILTTIGSVRAGQRYYTEIGEFGIFAGYQYQNIRQDITGSISARGTDAEFILQDLDFNVALKSKENHNASIAIMYDFGLGESWQMFAEYGFLNWKQVTVSAGYRF
ncbi:hypothetical protein [Vibrio rotiferianus]|uniref:hypothetical protein n=1 Tax=Vibrio rotiferianus TaxID=190895 RepID=UPI002895B3D4|nr:conserved exported hypothetical protein [Vibrio rotiferianus]